MQYEYNYILWQIFLAIMRHSYSITKTGDVYNNKSEIHLQSAPSLFFVILWLGMMMANHL
jgi:hypothetical protein